MLLGGASSWAAGAQPLGCLIEPFRVVDVGSPVIGVVESVKVERGDRVAKGQIVALLRADVERAAVGIATSRAKLTAEIHAAEANFTLARDKYTRAQGLVAKKFISDQSLDQTRAEAEVAAQRLEQARDQRRIWEHELRLAEAQLELRTIRSPAEGIIVERYMSGGERVEEKPIVRVATVNPLRVEIVVPASIYGTIPVGTSLMVTPDLPGAKPRPATVVLVDSIIDGPSNTFRVRLQMPNAANDVPAGPRCKVDLGIDTNAAGGGANARPESKPEARPAAKPPAKPEAKR